MTSSIAVNITGDSDYQVRGYVNGDETSLLSLYNQYYGPYAGSVPRSLQHWLWCCILHPDIGPERIFVACKGKETVGYAVVGRISQKEGGFLVYELCYDPTHNGEVVVTKLLEKIGHYVVGEKGNYVNLDAPSDDIVVRKVCDSLGFKQNPLSELMGFVILDPVKLIEHIIKGRDKGQMERNKTYLIRLKDTPTALRSISLRWRDGALSVCGTESVESGVIIDIDYSTLNKLIFGGESVMRAVLKRKLSVKPIWRFRQGFRLISLLSLRDPWYIPRLDQI